MSLQMFGCGVWGCRTLMHQYRSKESRNPPPDDRSLLCHRSAALCRPAAAHALYTRVEMGWRSDPRLEEEEEGGRGGRTGFPPVSTSSSCYRMCFCLLLLARLTIEPLQVIRYFCSSFTSYSAAFHNHLSFKITHADTLIYFYMLNFRN